MTILRSLEHNSLARKKVIIGVSVIVLTFSVLEIWSVNRLATYGDRINNLEQAKASLRMENQILENKIADKSSLNKVAKTSTHLGFQKVKNVEYLDSSNLALNY